MNEVNLDVLSAMVEKAERLEKLLKKNPEILEYLRLLGGVDEAHKTLEVVKVDKAYVRASAAAEMLKTDRHSIYRLEAEGFLPAYYLPGCSTKRYRVEDVYAVPQRRPPEEMAAAQ